jgi:hypothetical protein
MRDRMIAQQKREQAARLLQINPHLETIIRNREAALTMTPDKLQAIRREATAFGRMGWALKRQAKAVHRERYVTAMHGCKTSWPRILDHAKYICCAESR